MSPEELRIEAQAIITHLGQRAARAEDQVAQLIGALALRDARIAELEAAQSKRKGSKPQ